MHAMSHIVTSISDTDVTIILGLFVITGFALGYDHNHRLRPLFWKIPLLCVFTSSAILSVFFAIKFKSGLLLQMQFDRVNIELLRPAFVLHLFCLLLAALACFAVILLSLGPVSRPGEPP